MDQTHELITYVIPDFEAVRHFHREFVVANEFHILEELVASGFDIYLVEQWVYQRRLSTVVSTFTGNSHTKIHVYYFTTIKKPNRLYPPKFQEYLNEIMLNHGKLMKIDGPGDSDHSHHLFVTNITALPSNLNLIPIVQGDVRAIMDLFILNSSVKKLQCSGRSLSLVTEKISDASEDKFRYMYKIHNPTIPILFAIKELVNVIQISLFYFDLLDAKYCDGLLCSKTEEAIHNWWNLVGLPHFNTKPPPHSGPLPPPTVAAIISIILSTKIRLHLVGGCDVPKDPYDFENFMLSIGQFQKQYKLEKRRKLDLDTVLKLFSVTNSKLNHDKAEVYDDEYALASPYRRNKNYYSKEFKKLTNVVKSTVSDHIITRDNDNFYSESTPLRSSGVRIRNRIAKLADNVNPVDVETLDIDYLVKHHLSGKTLFRLWYGSVTSGEDRLNLLSNESKYRFVLLREAITNNREMAFTDSSRYSRGLNRVKLGLLSRRNLLSQPRPTDGKAETDTVTHELESVDDGSKDLVKEDHLPAPFHDDLEEFTYTLNRRTSYPFVGAYEGNINVMEFMLGHTKVALLECIMHQLRRTLSFSLVEDYYVHGEQGYVSRFTGDYMNAVSSLTQFHHLQEGLKHHDDVPTTATITRKYKQLNLELVKIHHGHNQIVSGRKRIMDDGFGALDFQLDELAATLDRIIYETRVVVQRINELEDNLRLLDSKLHDHTVKRLNKIISHLVNLTKFKAVFSPAERADLVLKLTGKSEPEQPDNLDTGVFRLVVIFIYDMIAFLFQLFKFDRSKMNLGRIRKSWRKLDPNRKYINRAYSYVGRDTSHIEDLE